GEVDRDLARGGGALLPHLARQSEVGGGDGAPAWWRRVSRRDRGEVGGESGRGRRGRADCGERDRGWTCRHPISRRPSRRTAPVRLAGGGSGRGGGPG